MYRLLMTKDLKDYIERELRFCKRRLVATKKPQTEETYWQGRIDGLNIMLNDAGN